MSMECLSLIFSGVVTISTIFYVILTRKLVTETRLMRKSQVEPHIIAYLDLAETSADFLYIKTKNVGMGVAFNVRFKIIKDIDYSVTRSLKDCKYFTEGVNYFPPNHEDVHLLFAFSNGEKFKKAEDNYIIEVSYESVLKEKKFHRYDLRIQELISKGKLTIPETHIADIAHQIKGIKDILQKDKK